MNAQSVLALVPSLFDNQRMYLSYSIFVVPVYAGLFIVSLLPGVLSCHDSGVESGLFLLCDGDNALGGSLLVSSEVQELVDEVRILFGLGKSFSRCAFSQAPSPNVTPAPLLSQRAGRRSPWRRPEAAIPIPPRPSRTAAHSAVSTQGRPRLRRLVSPSISR